MIKKIIRMLLLR